MTRPDGVRIGHAYPDQGHGGFALVAAPPGIDPGLPVQDGRPLLPGEDDGVLLTRGALTGELAAARVGDRIRLTVDDRDRTWRVAGVVSDFGGGAAGYVTPAGYAAATGTDGAATHDDRAAGMLRIVTAGHTAAERQQVLDLVADRLGDAGITPDRLLTTDDLRQALDVVAHEVGDAGRGVREG